MSPRSAEFLAEARARLVAARRDLDADDTSGAASRAYYGMLYAARAALSEEDRHAKTHRGTWDLFWQTFPETGKFDKALAAEARAVQELRELSDYEAKRPSIHEVESVLDLAERFVNSIEDLIRG